MEYLSFIDRDLIFFEFVFIGKCSEIDYDYFEQDKSDLVSIEKFLGKVDFKDNLKERRLFIGIRNVAKPNAVQRLSRDELEKN